MSINSLLNDKMLDSSNLKAFEDDKINITNKLKFISRRVENIVGKGENAGYQHFFLFPPCFQKISFSWLLKVGIMWLSKHNIEFQEKMNLQPTKV